MNNYYKMYKKRTLLWVLLKSEIIIIHPKDKNISNKISYWSEKYKKMFPISFITKTKIFCHLHCLIVKVYFKIRQMSRWKFIVIGTFGI